MLFALTLAGFFVLSAAICIIVPRVSPSEFDLQRAHYQRNHRTIGCRVTHMFGIPMLALSIPMLVYSWVWALGLFVVGSILQLAGHYVFEGNKPVLATQGRSRFTIVYACIFVVEEWRNLLTGRPLS